MPTAKRSGNVVALRSSGAPESRDKYEAIFDQASDAIATIAHDGRFDAVNQAFEELTGWMKPELAEHGDGVSVLIPPTSKLNPQSRVRPISLEIFSTPGRYEDLAIARKDGYIRYVDLSIRVLSGNGPALSIALFRDVTEKKSMERELITKHTELRNAYIQLEKKNAELHAMQETLVQSGKMAALGELAAGIAHELNQPLQGSRGYAQEIQALSGDGIAQTPAESPLRGGFELSLREIVSNVDKMAAIIDYLRTFTRKSTEKHEMTDVHHAIDEALKMLGRQFAVRGIEVERNYAKDLPKVYANPISLEQVFINLASNARDAIEAGGKGKGRITIYTKKSGPFVEILFRDDGPGMTERTKQKLFNPFFTTKEVGKGMGLGLSLSFGILNKLHGSIMVESELGRGAAFVVRLPQDFRETG